MSTVLSLPLVAVGGEFGESVHTAILMHEGYDTLPVKPHIDFAKRTIPVDGELWLVDGYLDRPLASWPVYAIRAARDHPVWEGVLIKQKKVKRWRWMTWLWRWWKAWASSKQSRPTE